MEVSLGYLQRRVFSNENNPMTPPDDAYGGDFSATRAHAHLEMHIKECAERRAEDRADRATFHARLNALQESFDRRMSDLTQAIEQRMNDRALSDDRRMAALNNRMWVAAVGLIILLSGIVGWLLPHWVQK